MSDLGDHKDFTDPVNVCWCSKDKTVSGNMCTAQRKQTQAYLLKKGSSMCHSVLSQRLTDISPLH